MRWIDYQNGIYAFDADYVRPLLAAIHLIVDEGKAALVDTGTNDSLPASLAALKQVGLTPADVQYVILTHIHLDHAGGAGTMMQAFPNAKLVVHPRGSRHMVDPSKLLAGVRAVYGDDATAKLYGELPGVPSERIIEATDGLELPLGQRKLVCIDTPGHARHHICIVDSKTSGIFTGDLFGLSYREMDVDGRAFILPTTTPSQFDRDEMHASIDRVLNLKPEACYLTHYSRVQPVGELGQKLHEMLDRYCEIALEAQREIPESSQHRHQTVVNRLGQYLISEIRQHGCTLPENELLKLLDTDIELNAQGLSLWCDQQVQKH